MKKHFLLFTLTLCVLLTKANPAPYPASEKVILDNKKMKVTEYNSQPGEPVCGKGKHSHPAHLTVLLTEAEVSITLPNGKMTHQKSPAGTTFWSEAETHTVLNSGKNAVRAYLIETKN